MSSFAGFLGGLVTMLGTVFPPLLIMSFVSVFYEMIAKNQYVRMYMTGMQAGVAALLVSIFIDMFINVSKKKSVLYSVLAVFSFVIARYTNISILYVALVCGIAGLIKTKMIGKELHK